jgi:hypothetical protein
VAKVFVNFFHDDDRVFILHRLYPHMGRKT